MTDEVHPALAEEGRTFTFQEWITETLKEVDPGITVRDDGLDRLRIMANGDWHIATIYNPPRELLSAWLDVYPRQVQTEIFRRLIFSINAWCGVDTDTHTGLPFSKATS